MSQMGDEETMMMGERNSSDFLVTYHKNLVLCEHKNTGAIFNIEIYSEYLYFPSFHGDISTHSLVIQMLVYNQLL